jgi:hypothetical protein
MDITDETNTHSRKLLTINVGGDNNVEQDGSKDPALSLFYHGLKD